MSDAVGRCLRPPGEYALERALWLWREDIIDPRQGDRRPFAERSRLAIDRMIRGPQGIGTPNAQGGGSIEGEYLGDKSYAWCGAFVATCWAHAGLNRHFRRKLASTERLKTIAEELGGGRLLKPKDARAGDILVVGHKDRRFGDHITLVVEQANGWWRTVEGNATGLGPDGLRRQGVVRTERGPAEVRYVVRPAPEDLNPIPSKEP